jgi:hypothetical protein
MASLYESVGEFDAVLALTRRWHDLPFKHA